MPTDSVCGVKRMDIVLDRGGGVVGGGVSRYLQGVERVKLYLIERMNQ